MIGWLTKYLSGDETESSSSRYKRPILRVSGGKEALILNDGPVSASYMGDRVRVFEEGQKTREFIVRQIVQAVILYVDEVHEEKVEVSQG